MHKAHLLVGSSVRGELPGSTVSLLPMVFVGRVGHAPGFVLQEPLCSGAVGPVQDIVLTVLKVADVLASPNGFEVLLMLGRLKRKVLLNIVLDCRLQLIRSSRLVFCANFRHVPVSRRLVLALESAHRRSQIVELVDPLLALRIACTRHGAPFDLLLGHLWRVSAFLQPDLLWLDGRVDEGISGRADGCGALLLD